MRNYLMLFVTLLFLSGFCSLNAQTTVTFKVNITDLTNAQEFDPERDRVELIGNRYPLSATMPAVMKQDEENPDLFTTEVTFPGSMANQPVEYQFRVRLNHSYRNEDIPRTLRVSNSDISLPSIYFNSYAW